MADSTSYQNSRQYVNTMMFAIIAGIVSLIMLALVWRASELVQPYSAFIVTVEVGLTLIIVAAIVRIIAYERRFREQARNAQNNMLAVSSCPDYWTRNKNMCVSAYQHDDPDSPTPTVFYMDQPTTSTGVPQVNTLNLGDYTDLPIAEVCDKVRGMNAPWTDVSAVCNSFNL
jgi:hypothetical protein